VRPDNDGGALGQRRGSQTSAWSASDTGAGQKGLIPAHVWHHPGQPIGARRLAIERLIARLIANRPGFHFRQGIHHDDLQGLH
jgi:hypothetical protein